MSKLLTNRKRLEAKAREQVLLSDEGLLIGIIAASLVVRPYHNDNTVGEQPFILFTDQAAKQRDDAVRRSPQTSHTSSCGTCHLRPVT
jgi:hypothetical protein